MNKDILFIATVFILVILAIYFVFINGGLSANPAFNLLNSIKQDTQIDFSNIKEQQFTYKYESGDNQEIKGMGYVALNITNDQSDAVRKYFEDNGFKIDFFEMGTDLSGISYYSREKNACMIKISILTDEQGLPQAVNKLNVAVSCGVLAK
jgi:phosphoglycerol transferase MdoB-like AlkP superfamily enzyme